MPIYEYTCTECDARFEKFVRSIAQDADIHCPECGGSQVKKGWSLFGTKLNAGPGALPSAAGDCAPTGT